MRVAPTLPGLPPPERRVLLARVVGQVHRRHLRPVPAALSRRASALPPASDRATSHRVGGAHDRVGL